MSNVISLLVLFGGLALLMSLVVKGKSIFVAAPCCALVTASLSGCDPLATMTGPFMAGFAKYIQDWYLVFALGAAFGKLMEQSGAASAIANRIGHWLGTERACLSVVLACAVLTYGGVSLFVVGFSVFPLAVQLFRSANLPRQFIPAAIAFGSITFTMTSAGSPEIQNLMPIKYLVANDAAKSSLTDARAGWPVSLIVSAVMFGIGQWYLNRTIRREIARGGRWEPRDNDVAEFTQSESAPGFVASIMPLVVTLASLNVLPIFSRQLEDPALSIFLGVLTGLVTLRRQITGAWRSLGDGFVNGLVAIGSTASVVGFGTALKGLPAFTLVIDWVTHLPLEPLFSAAIAVAIISAMAGSASGGQGIAFPIIKPIFVDTQLVAPRALHRVVSISSGTLDSLPHNGFLVMLIQNICGETHARSYRPIFVTTVVVPAIGTTLAIALFKLVPAWGLM